MKNDFTDFTRQATEIEIEIGGVLPGVIDFLTKRAYNILNKFFVRKTQIPEDV